MKKLLRKLFNWAMDDRSLPREVRTNTPFDPVRANQTTAFTVIKAQNGMILQTYEYNRDGTTFWVVPDGTSVGNMVDTVLVSEKLK